MLSVMEVGRVCGAEGGVGNLTMKRTPWLSCQRCLHQTSSLQLRKLSPFFFMFFIDKIAEEIRRESKTELKA